MLLRTKSIKVRLESNIRKYHHVLFVQEESVPTLVDYCYNFGIELPSISRSLIKKKDIMHKIIEYKQKEKGKILDSATGKRIPLDLINYIMTFDTVLDTKRHIRRKMYKTAIESSSESLYPVKTEKGVLIQWFRDKGYILPHNLDLCVDKMEQTYWYKLYMMERRRHSKISVPYEILYDMVTNRIQWLSSLRYTRKERERLSLKELAFAKEFFMVTNF